MRRWTVWGFLIGVLGAGTVTGWVYGQQPQTPLAPAPAAAEDGKPQPAGPEVTVQVVGPDEPLRIADKTYVSVELKHPSSYVFEGLGPTPANNARMRLLNQTHETKTLDTGEVVERFDYTLQPMATGRFYFKSMTFTLLDAQKQPRTIDSQVVSIKVVATLDVRAEEAEARAPRGPLAIMEADPRPYYAGAGLLVILLLMPGIVHAWRRRKALAAAAEAAAVPRLPPWEEAKTRMDGLREANLVEQDERLFHFELSDILRGYLVRRYHLSAPELTASEIIQQLRALSWGDSSHLKRLEGVLLDCDLVKFARFTPGLDRSLRALSETDALLDLTRPVPVVEEASVQGVEPSQGPQQDAPKDAPMEAPKETPRSGE